MGNIDGTKIISIAHSFIHSVLNLDVLQQIGIIFNFQKG